MRRWLAGVALAVVSGAGQGAIITFDIVPASDQTAETRTIQTGSRIQYLLTARVTSEDPDTPDNGGLAMFSIDIETNLGVAQPPLEMFRSEIEDNFTLFPSLGTPVDDDIRQISASQDTIGGNVTAGIGLDDTIILGTGFLQSPDQEGEFTVILGDNTTGSVLVADLSSGPPFAQNARVRLGDGFRIITSDDAPVDPGLAGGAAPGGPQSGVMAVASLGVVFTAMFLGMTFGGPWGVAIGLMVGSLIGLIMLFAGG